MGSKYSVECCELASSTILNQLFSKIIKKSLCISRKLRLPIDFRLSVLLEDWKLEIKVYVLDAAVSIPMFGF